MTPGERRAAFSAAFYKQATSDWAVYKLLSAPGVALPDGLSLRCHVLHYLQMATEKIAKAYRIRDNAGDVDQLARHHTGFAAFVNQLMNSKVIRDEWHGSDASRESQRQSLHRLAEVIERLAPAIDNLATPENAEYPWERGEQVFTPCEFSYPHLDFLREKSGLALLNLVERAIRDYGKIEID